MTVKNSGSFNSKLNIIRQKVILEPQKSWREEVQTFMQDFVDTYFSIALGNCYLISNSDATGINVSDEYMEISGTYEVDENNLNISGSTSGFLTYTGDIEKSFLVMSTMHKTVTGGGTPRTAQRVYINSSPVSSSRMIADIKSNLGESSTLIENVKLEPNDSLHIEITNLDGTDNILVDTHHLIIHSIN